MHFTLTTILKKTPICMAMLLIAASYAHASNTLQEECGLSERFVSSLQKQRAGDVARLARLRSKVASLGIQRFPGAIHSLKDFAIKLPLGSTVIPFANTAAGITFDGLTANCGATGVSLYDIDYGEAVVAVVPEEKDAVQWERFLVSTVRSPEDILFREPDGVIYYDHKRNELVAVYHQYQTISGLHIVGRASVSGIPCAIQQRREPVVQPVEACNCDMKNHSHVSIKPETEIGSGLSVESDMPKKSVHLIASAGTASANAHSRCVQPRSGGLAEIIRMYSMLRTLNPEHRDSSDTYTKAYSINNYGVKDAYIVWNKKKEGGVLLGDGTVVVPPRYCSLYVDTFGYVVTDDKGVGVLDFAGNTILPCKYTLFTLKDNGLLKVGQQAASSSSIQYGLYDLQKREWVEPIKM